MNRKSAQEDTAVILQARLRAADEHITVPPGLWERIQQSPVDGRDAPRGRRPRQRFAMAATAFTIAAAVCAIVFGTWWLARSPVRPVTPAHSAVTLTVYNAEAPCRTVRTLECALHLARDPYTRYAAPGNSVGKVWHADRVEAECVVTDATLVQDESGITSARWYLVTTTGNVRGWLPGVRTRNTVEVRTCSAAEVAASRPH
jgi:hypothetical protein